MKTKLSLAVLVFLTSLNVVFSGPLQRVANTTLQFPANPPTFGFVSTNAFPGLTFTNPICITSPPGETNRLFIVGKNGPIWVITNLVHPTRSLFMDISSEVTSTTVNSGDTGEQGLLSMVFHPGFATNHYFYLFYTGQATNFTSGLHDILSRFTISTSNTNQGNASSEVRFIAQYDRDPNHNSGDLHFGPDGYLYVTVGDEGKEYDGRTNAQHIDWNLFSGMLRIDVDKRHGNLAPNPGTEFATSTNYLIPSDNPFIGATQFDGATVNSNNVHTEFWAVGLRNPWRFSFDPLTEVLYCGDVGQDKLEEVDVIRKGGNYGWAKYEGTNTPPSGVSQTGRPTPQNPIPPILTYAHGTGSNQGNAVMGGVVYRGQRFPQLYGDYVFADYVDGNVWAIPASQTNGTAGPPSPLLSNPDASANITAFGVDPHNGDVLYTSHHTTGYATAATIQRIIYNNSTNGAPLPPTLADTGAFTNLMALSGPQDTLLPASGIVPYNINVPFWSDNAIKSRWFSVPKTNLTIGFSANANWSFPTGTVWVKNFNLELTNGDSTSQIRLETRFIIKNSSGVYGLTYRWGGSRTNATLVAAEGMDENFVVNNGGILQTQTWHYPSQQECQFCHTSAGGYGLGFRTEQLNDDFTYPGGTTNEINALSDAGYFSAPMTNDVNSLLALATATNTSASLEFRSRSFLMANCSQCHQPGGSAQASLWDARITTPTAQAGLIYGALENNLGDTNNYVIKPDSLTNSILFTRTATRGANSIQMPPLDSNLTDTDATNVLAQWILSMTDTFWVGASPISQTVTAGNTTTNFTVTSVATSDFSGNVSLSAIGLPANSSATFTPGTITGGNGTATMKISTTTSTPNGTYTIGVVGSGSGISYTNNITLIVTGSASPDFTISASPSSQTVIAGSNTTYTATVAAINGFSGTVTFSASGLPGGAGYNFNPTSVTGAGSSTLTVTTSTSTPPGNYNLTVTGTSESLVHNTNVTLNVTSGSTNLADLYFEAENISYVATGATAALQTDTNTSGGEWIALNATNVGPFIDYTLPNIPAGIYEIRMLYKAHPNRGILDFTVDGADYGTLDQYTNPPTYPEVNFGTATFASTANHDIRLTVTGKNALAGAYTLSADAFRLVPQIYFEAENISYVATGAPAAVQMDTNTSGGEWIALNATNVGPFIDYTLPNVPAGTYSVNLLYKAHPNRGILDFTVDGVDYGTLDQYTNPPTYPEVNFGIAEFPTTTNHDIRQTVTGKNPLAGAYTLSADAFRMAKAYAPEAENLSFTTNGATATIVSDGNASGGEWVELNSTATNTYIEFTVTAIRSGTYDLGLLYEADSDRGILSLSVDGVAVGNTLDEYSASPTYPENDFGNISFNRTGNHTVRLTVVGKNNSSSSYKLSADAFVLNPQ